MFWSVWWYDNIAPGISASPSEENMRYFNVMILGPSQSPYEGSSDPLYGICLLLIYDPDTTS